MAEETLKIEADSRGVWISALSDDLTWNTVVAFLRSKGVRKYDEKAVEEFVRQKNRTRWKVAERDPEGEKALEIVVQVDKNALNASVVLEAPFFLSPWPGEQEIVDALTRKGVVFGIEKDVIEKLVNLKIVGEAVTVARGREPRNGEHAKIELLLDPDKTPEVNEEAQKVDYRTRSVFVNVVKGQEIAVKHPATAGEDGMSVLGTVIRAVAGKDASFLIGSGVEVSEDGLSLRASIDGRLSRKDGKLVVLPELEVRNDVDFSVGNINFMGSVKIRGSVREGFQVVAGGNIEIREMVEGAHVESVGDIVIMGGVRGMGKGHILAGGNVLADFADQANIRSQGDVKIKNAIFHSEVSAQNSVTVLGGQKSQIAGGKIQAGLEVVCQTLGSEMGTKTEVIVGLPPAQMERRKELQTQIARNRENIDKLDANLSFLKKQDAAGALDEGKRALLVTGTKSRFQLQGELKAMESELKVLEERLELSKSKGVVRVKGVCYPGVSIAIRGSVYMVREVLKFSAFISEGGEVRLKPFDV
ncbi:MAG: FapA family protein [Synergistaceae bacterium]|nr:FapA family protein [Synergistaceae bacterium]